MILKGKIKKAIKMIKEEGLDALCIGPSPDLEYLTGLNPLSDERFKALFLLKNGLYLYISPELCVEESKEALGEDVPVISWGDSEGFLKAIEKAKEQFGLNNFRIGVNGGIRAVDIIDISGVLNVTFLNATRLMEELRIIKTRDEIEKLKKAAAVADEVAEKIAGYIKPGMTEKDIKEIVEKMLLEFGGEELAFETIVASGPNSSKPHYNEYSRTIQEKDVIILDFGCRVGGFCSDISRTYFVGEPTEEQRKIYDIVLKANIKGEVAVREGVTAEEVDRAARNVIKEAGYGEFFFNRVGHGIGFGVHEAPYIMEGNKTVLKSGMAFSVEPGIYIPGKFGMRVEDIVVVTENGCEVLNKATKDMIVIR
ncbi:M24 family metallopeptidase [Thermovenabulum sp.]|uniref:M24 family metallopeptidase n=1 Tax=Thermovenabulum sp. TaxID=3100335 RepID=UPI003C79D2FD